MVVSVPPLPPGSEQIALWARSRQLGYEACPGQAWFEQWEPYDTMVSPEIYYNAVSWGIGPHGTVTLVEPWLAPPGGEPVDRTLMVFVQHPMFARRAAARGGEHFNTRVVFLQGPPPPQVAIGDKIWDAHLLTWAASAAEAAAAFPPPVRYALAEWGFSGHIEVRPGGLVVNHARVKPAVRELDPLLFAVSQLLEAYRSALG